MGAINREKWVDNAKGIGILLVVLGHSIGYAGGGGHFGKLHVI